MAFEKKVGRFFKTWFLQLGFSFPHIYNKKYNLIAKGFLTNNKKSNAAKTKKKHPLNTFCDQNKNIIINIIIFLSEG